MGQGHDIRDGLITGPAKGRGAGLNPGNRFEDIRLHVLAEHYDEIAADSPDGTRIITQVFRDSSRSILNHYDSPDMGAGWSINPYRGCEHGCIYCYARPTHEYLGLSSGMDFETKILAKHDAANLLRKEFAAPGWNGERLMFSGVTDPYQPIESRLLITRSILEACVEFAQPVSLITKNRLITRDIDLLSELNRHGAVHAHISLTTLDNRLAARMEPRASSPRERLDAIRRLSSAGIPTSVMTAPIIPALNEPEIPALLEAARDAGATGAGFVLLRLPYQNKDLFLDWLRREFPDRAAHVESAIRDTHDGRLYRSDFGIRHTGTGARAEQIAALFKVFKRKLGLEARWTSLSSDEFMRRKGVRESRGQLGLFSEC